jgi:hypothetical protein
VELIPVVDKYPAFRSFDQNLVVFGEQVKGYFIYLALNKLKVREGAVQETPGFHGRLRKEVQKF